MKIEILKFNIMNCSNCRRDTLMAEVKIEVGKGEYQCSPFMFFCSGCGSYFELESVTMKRNKPIKRQEGPTGPEV